MKSLLANSTARKWAAVGTVLIILVVFGLWRHNVAVKAAMPGIQTATVKRGTIRHTVVGTGTITAKTTVDVKSLAGGEVTSLLVREGDTVKKGDLIATIDPLIAQQGVNQAQAGVSGAQAQVAQALHTKSLDSAQIPEKIRSDLQGVDIARAKLRQADENLILAQGTTTHTVDESVADVAAAKATVDKTSTTKDLDTGATTAALTEALQERDAANSKLAQAKINLALEEESHIYEVETAKQNRDAAAARLQSAQLDFGTQPAVADEAVHESEAALASNQQHLDQLINATQPQNAASAQGEYQASKTALSNAQADLKRARELFAKGFVTQQSVEQAEATLASAQSRFDTADQAWTRLKAFQDDEREQAEAAVTQSKATLAKAKQTAADARTTAYAATAAAATLAAAEQALKQALANERNIALRQEDVRQAEQGLKQAEAGVDSAKANLLQVPAAAADVANAEAAKRHAEVARLEAESQRGTVALREDDVKQARLALDQAQSQLLQDKASLEKIKVDQATADQAVASVKNNQANLVLANKTYHDIFITAPRDGVVAVRNVEVGTVIASGQSSVTTGTTIVTLDDITDNYNLAVVDESDMAQVAIGNTVTFKVEAWGDRIFNGWVRKIYPQGVSVQNVVQFTVEIGIKPTDVNMRPGMSTDCEILVETKENTLILPAEGVRADTSGYYAVVPRKKGDKTSKKPKTPGASKALDLGTQMPVKIGIQTAKNVEILEGLNEGDVVITGVTKPGAGGTSGQQEQVNKAMMMGTKGMTGK
jgi:multidrug efflux pump subunit AcrA (membrane-fusion protein)